MTIIRNRERLRSELQDKELRDFFVSEHINIGLSFQIRALRKQRGWTQKELSDRAKKKQSWIAKIENPNYTGFSLQTLKELASVFDVALIVRFVPFGELVKWELTLSPEKLEALSFNEDPYFKEMPQQESITAYSQPEPPNYSHISSGGVCSGREGIIKFTNPSEPSMKEIPNISDYRKPSKPQREMESPLKQAMMGG